MVARTVLAGISWNGIGRMNRGRHRSSHAESNANTKQNGELIKHVTSTTVFNEIRQSLAAGGQFRIRGRIGRNVTPRGMVTPSVGRRRYRISGSSPNAIRIPMVVRMPRHRNTNRGNVTR